MTDTRWNLEDEIVSEARDDYPAMSEVKRDHAWLTFFQSLADIARDHGYDDIAEVAEGEATRFIKEMRDDGTN